MPPSLLLKFDPAEWPAEDVEASIALWNAARKEFAAVHGWPGGFVAMLQEALAIEEGLRWPSGGPSPHSAG